jgi:hypothetical protein
VVDHALFSTIPGGTHGHHTASAVLAVEAFQLCGDPTAFPEQLATLTPWQPKRILLNGKQFSARSAGQQTPRRCSDDNAKTPSASTRRK